MSCPFQPNTTTNTNINDNNANDIINLTAKQKLYNIWYKINEKNNNITKIPKNIDLNWPNTQDILNEIKTKDYNNLFVDTIDETDGDKLLCRNGAIACVYIEWYKYETTSPTNTTNNNNQTTTTTTTPYTGLFNQCEYGLIRLSSALMPLSVSSYIPYLVLIIKMIRIYFHVLL